ncbi:hypothetical protein [Streptomyces sp. JV184]|uniref:hypothetical protein n=1 Tax=Streptomyces sp. JV184 TaxID=858637 RepID=UPI002E77B000|nr:hypothetical protein [Streptomyces sp. JV184]MEE1743398.1 hypothetical protein [Streptomyces sp. JV184]
MGGQTAEVGQGRDHVELERAEMETAAHLHPGGDRVTRPAQRLLQPLSGGGVAVLEPELQLTAEKADDRDGTCVLTLGADEPAVREPLRMQDIPGTPERDGPGMTADFQRQDEVPPTVSCPRHAGAMSHTL